MKRCSIFKVVNWYTFADLFNPNGVNQIPYEEDGFSSIVDFLDICASMWFTNTEQQVDADKLPLELFQMLYRRYWTHYVANIEKENPTEDDVLSIAREFVIRLTNIFVQTKDRYITLLNVYASEKNKLLDGIKTTTIGVGKFNDTPQNIIDGDEFGDNQHISNITKSTAEAISDADTKINRLDEITRKYRNIMMDWTNEFDGLFIESENVI